jgi:hypothetical protein
MMRGVYDVRLKRADLPHPYKTPTKRDRRRSAARLILSTARCTKAGANLHTLDMRKALAPTG